MEGDFVIRHEPAMIIFEFASGAILAEWSAYSEVRAG
jgi:hypothetical protein